MSTPPSPTPRNFFSKFRSYIAQGRRVHIGKAKHCKESQSNTHTQFECKSNISCLARVAAGHLSEYVEIAAVLREELPSVVQQEAGRFFHWTKMHW